LLPTHSRNHVIGEFDWSIKESNNNKWSRAWSGVQAEKAKKGVNIGGYMSVVHGREAEERRRGDRRWHDGESEKVI